MAVNIESNAHVEKLMVGRSLTTLKLAWGQRGQFLDQEFGAGSRLAVVAKHLIEKTSGVVLGDLERIAIEEVRINLFHCRPIKLALLMQNVYHYLPKILQTNANPSSATCTKSIR